MILFELTYAYTRTCSHTCTHSLHTQTNTHVHTHSSHACMAHITLTPHALMHIHSDYITDMHTMSCIIIHNTHTLTGMQAHLLATSFPGLCPQLYLRYGPDCARAISFYLLQFSQKKTTIIEWHSNFCVCAVEYQFGIVHLGARHGAWHR